MAREANPTTIGAFVLGAVALLVAGLLFFGGADFWKEKRRYTLFFDGSVNGLSVGAPVKFRGVTIGRVEGVFALMDIPNEEVQIQVQIETDAAAFRTIDGDDDRSGTFPVAALVRDRGMRAKLKSQSFLTGQLYVDFDFYPGSPITLVDFNTPYPELPTLPSDMERFQRAADQLAGRFQEIPLERIADRLLSVLAGIDDIVNSEDLRASVEELRAALVETRKFAAELAEKSGPVLVATRETLEQLRASLESFDQRIGPLAKAATATFEGFEPDAAIPVELGRTLGEVRKAAQALRRLADTLDEEPNSLLFGRSDERSE
jgi:paraquat-inducible protein B